MVSLSYVGGTQVGAADLVSRGYVEALVALNLSQSSIDSMITNALAPYATKASVDTKDLLNATKSFIDVGDATRLKLSQKGTNSGITPLDAQGRVAVSRISVASTQRYPKPFISPSAYNGSNVTATSTDVQVYTCSVADPGFAYKIFATGVLDGFTSVDGEYALVKVHQGSTSGQVVASGYGLAEKYAGGLTTPILVSGTYNVPAFANTLDVIALGGSGGGDGGGTVFGFPVAGSGGAAGGVSGVTLTRNTTLPSGTNTLNVTIGTGGTGGAGGAFGFPGAAGTNGTPTTITGTGVTTVSGAGGAHGGSGGTPGGTPNVSFNGVTYPAGTGGAANTPGTAPGGGGGGGAAGIGPVAGQPGAAGSSGAAWIVAYGTITTPTGPVPIAPTALNAQTVITGATTLYVTVVRVGSASTQTITTTRPQLFVVPFPA